MRVGGPLGNDEPFRDLTVGQALGDQQGDLRSRLVKARSDGLSVVGAGSPALSASPSTSAIVWIAGQLPSVGNRGLEGVITQVCLGHEGRDASVHQRKLHVRIGGTPAGAGPPAVADEALRRIELAFPEKLTLADPWPTDNHLEHAAVFWRSLDLFKPRLKLTCGQMLARDRHRVPCVKRMSVQDIIRRRRVSRW